MRTIQNILRVIVALCCLLPLFAVSPARALSATLTQYVVQLKWTIPGSDLGSIVYRGEDGASLTPYMGVGGSTYDDNNTYNNHTYTYKIVFYNGFTGAIVGEEGPATVEVKMDAPSSIKATSASNGNVILEWGSVPIAYGYLVYRGDDGATPTHATTTGGNVFTDQHVQNGHSYVYGYGSRSG